MKYQKFSKLEKKEHKQHAVAEALSGAGTYLFVNNTNADIKLPRATKSGLREIGPRAQFQGDDYYMQMVRTGELRLVKVLQTPEQELQTNLQEQNMSDKLILDQPDTITQHGKVEHVVAPSPRQPLHEAGGQTPPPVLLNEGPVDNGFVIVDDE